MRTSVNSLIWTPEGRRCITGTQSGEFTLWNGTQFNFETIIQVMHILCLQRIYPNQPKRDVPNNTAHASLADLDQITQQGCT